MAGLRRKETVLSVMRALATLKMGVADAHGDGVEFPPDVSIS